MFKIKKEVLEQVLNYLARQPFVEVQKLISDLQQAEEIKKEEKK